ncbi:MAG: Glycosyl transferase, group 1 family [Candidatus Moranbacteria bacterium GW2011_GWE2_35_2-]|nr:MAG: Glycosyl transferase, group 1 family [Candidatus Moranbacteria bacterium GW2011_GWE2_35_2-]KKQ04873.1 MAG: Glycosyl transferase, group 1 family [Candidatus Moranbacteria bacterium GW2011_GWF1_36_4]KKQ22890.1 MAG: Glycosyl transferase, group 1 family [Candidatus Moranbacteria bacterium GW2011_GWF2_37_11]KKQ29248.1 MAG: Glycosyl transferase, group 1 family [Candidatus Moranbacteria bacterium GW2011_GWD1_37_17]KKQ30879.1 MAG: Glycosyl transferase, group 1 family [Candidatus Moranbacteria b
MEKPNYPKILFISRAYPPILGGIENQNYEISKSLSEIADVKIIANKFGRKMLPLFAPYALIQIIFLLPKYDVILLGDGVLSIIGWFVKLFSQKPVISIAHGLDLNWNSSSLGVWYEKILIKLYKKLWVEIFFEKIDKFIAVGNTTIKEGVKLGIPKEKFVFVPNGVDTEKFLGTRNYSRHDLEKTINMNLSEKKVLLTLGRLARRKGVAWFIENVMPKLPNNIIYVVSGNGPDKENIKAAIKRTKQFDRVKLFGPATDPEKFLLYNTVDLFVQPNIKVAGDMEGFGLVVLEAAVCRRVVITSELEGLKDAITNGKNGFLVDPENTEKYAAKIKALLENDDVRKIFGERAREFVKENYTWEIIAKKYLEEIKKTII